MADPYLEGDLAPVRTDHTAVDLAVTGTTPEGADALCEVGVGGVVNFRGGQIAKASSVKAALTRKLLGSSVPSSEWPRRMFCQTRARR